jgi:hypothetical protein
MRTIVPLALVSVVAGCATGSYTPPTPNSLPAYERIVEKGFDETWTALVDYASGAFFAIDNFEKASGLMTLRFGSLDPSAFVDCGQFKIDGPQPFSGAYVDAMLRYGAKLDGRMNISVRSLDTNRTRVRVNARYVFTVPDVPSRTDSRTDTWAFDSGGSATVTVRNALSGTTPTRTCQPTYRAERAVLGAVAK